MISFTIGSKSHESGGRKRLSKARLESLTPFSNTGSLTKQRPGRCVPAEPPGISKDRHMLNTLTELSNNHSRYLTMTMVTGLLMASVAACGGSKSTLGGPPAPQFIVCKSTYALCTTALCSPIPGDDQNVSCDCNVTTGYSAGTTQCPGVRKTSEGQTVISRYFPIKSYLQCSNDRPWAMCLNSPCLINPINPSQASCKCTVLADQGPYIIVNADGGYSHTSCINGVNSYATVADVDQITFYLITHNTPLRPFPIAVFTPAPK